MRTVEFVQMFAQRCQYLLTIGALFDIGEELIENEESYGIAVYHFPSRIRFLCLKSWNFRVFKVSRFQDSQDFRASSLNVSRFQDFKILGF